MEVEIGVINPFEDFLTSEIRLIKPNGNVLGPFKASVQSRVSVLLNPRRTGGRNLPRLFSAAGPGCGRGWGPGGLGRLDPGCPSAGREFGDSIERKIGQAREDRAEVVADR